MPHASRTRRPSAAAFAPALLAVALSACTLVPSIGERTWGLATTNQAGKEQTITVSDTSGIVASVAFDPEDADLFGGVTAPAGLANTLDVAWTEGACDEQTLIDIARAGAGLAIRVSVTVGGEGCDAFGTPRAIRLTLSQPVAPGVVTLTQQGA